MRRVGFSIVSVGVCSVCALTACLSSSTPAADDGGAGSQGDDAGGLSASSSGAGQSGSSGSPGTTSSSGSPGSSGSTTTGGDSGSVTPPAGTTLMPLLPDPNGYIDPSSNSIGVQGAWYAYGDDWGTNGAPPGVCESTGMHASSVCSSITFPPPAVLADGGYTSTFPQTTAGTMCIAGTAAKVVGGDYSNIFGIGIGLDFNNQGGVKMPYSATANKVTGFSFHISGIPTGASVRVELPIPATAASGDAWSITALADGDYIADLTTVASDPHPLKPSFTSTGTQPPFDATMVQSIQFHIPTNVTAAITIPMSTMLCVSNFQAIVKSP
jgi:hypothetical protein